jgi:hypothetical protein
MMERDRQGVIGIPPFASANQGVFVSAFPSATPGGSFEGERLSGDVLDGGNDWQTVRADGSTALDVRLVLKTADGALIAMTCRGIRQGPPEVISRIENGEAVDPESYYFRIAPLFETASEKYAWLDNVVGVGAG